MSDRIGGASSMLPECERPCNLDDHTEGNRDKAKESPWVGNPRREGEKKVESDSKDDDPCECRGDPDDASDEDSD